MEKFLLLNITELLTLRYGRWSMRILSTDTRNGTKPNASFFLFFVLSIRVHVFQSQTRKTNVKKKSYEVECLYNLVKVKSTYFEVYEHISTTTSFSKTPLFVQCKVRKYIQQLMFRSVPEDYF